MNILLVDDHAIVLEGLKALLAAALRDATLHTATQAADARALLAEGGVDLLVADLDLRGESGLALIEEAHRLSPATRVLVYTLHEEPWTVRQILDADVDAVVMKSDDAGALVTAVNLTAKGRAYYSPTFSRLLAVLDAHPERLTAREQEVVRLTSEGLSTAATARRLGVTQSTIEFHRRRIMQKLQAANAAEMVKRAADLGLGANV